MSVNKNGISPFKDPAFLKGSANKRKTEISDKDINEFREAFNDSDEVKTYKPKKNTFPPPSEKIPAEKNTEAPISREALYEKPSVDIDAFFEKLTGTPAPKKKTTSHKAIKEPSSAEKTRLVSLGASRKKSLSDTKVPVSENKNIKKNVRVLVKSKQSDKHILDIAPVESEKTNVIDVLGTVKGENIFEAVDKAVTKDSTSAAYAAAMESVSRKEKQERDKRAILNGKALRDELIKQNNTRKLRLLFSAVLFFLSLVFGILPSFYTEGGSLSFLFSNGARVYSVINILLLIILASVFYPSYLRGIKGIIKLSPDSNSTLVTVTLFILVYNVALLILGSPGNWNYTCFAPFMAGLNCLSDFFAARNTLGSLATVMRGKSLCSVQPIERKQDALTIAKGITDKGDPNVLYSTDVEISDSLTGDTGPRHSQDKFYSYAFVAAIVPGLILAVAAYFIGGGAVSLITVLLSAVCFCSPVTVNTACTLLGYTVNRRLNKDAAAVTSNEALHSVGKAHGVTMDISDIFTAEVSSFCLVPGVTINRNTAALYTSAVLINGKSLAGKSFKSFIKQTGSTLPATENLQYEDKLGFSAWVGDNRVLVGNREMLIQHSIPAPDEREEKHYAGNRFVMYLVVDGRLTASFLVNYKALSSVKSLTGEFNKTGLVLLLTCREPFLDNKEIAKRLAIESAAIKVLSGKSEAITRDYRSSKSTSLQGGLICSKAGRGLLSLVVNSYKLYVCDRFLFNLHIAGQIIALLLIALAVFLNMPVFFSPLTIIGLQLIWSISSFVLTFNRSKNF